MQNTKNQMTWQQISEPILKEFLIIVYIVF